MNVNVDDYTILKLEEDVYELKKDYMKLVHSVNNAKYTIEKIELEETRVSENQVNLHSDIQRLKEEVNELKNDYMTLLQSLNDV